MKSKIAGLLIVGLLAGPIPAQAAVTFSTDTATDLVGTSAVTGASAESANPGVFDFGLSFCTQVLAGAQSPGSVSGTTSPLAGSAVPTFHFAFSELQDTGGADGTPSGFYPPVAPPSVATNLARAGRTIPQPAEPGWRLLPVQLEDQPHGPELVQDGDAGPA